MYVCMYVGATDSLDSTFKFLKLLKLRQQKSQTVIYERVLFAYFVQSTMHEIEFAEIHKQHHGNDCGLKITFLALIGVTTWSGNPANVFGLISAWRLMVNLSGAKWKK